MAPWYLSSDFDEWEIKRVLIDQGSCIDIVYSKTFERLRLDPEDLKPLKGSLIGFYREQVQLKGYITLNTTFREKDQAKKINVQYLVIDAPSSYNIIIGRQAFNQLSSILLTMYLCMKYMFSNGRVGVIQENVTLRASR